MTRYVGGGVLLMDVCPDWSLAQAKEPDKEVFQRIVLRELDKLRPLKPSYCFSVARSSLSCVLSELNASAGEASGPGGKAPAGQRPKVI